MKKWRNREQRRTPGTSKAYGDAAIDAKQAQALPCARKLIALSREDRVGGGGGVHGGGGGGGERTNSGVLYLLK